MKLEQSLDNIKPVESERLKVYTIGNLEYLSAGALYTGNLPPMGPGGFGGGGFGNSGGPKFKDYPMFGGFKPIGSFSDFGLSKDFNRGPGILKESFNFLERYRAGEHEDYGKDHLNLEYLSPITGKSLINIHIDMKDKE